MKSNVRRLVARGVCAAILTGCLFPGAALAELPAFMQKPSPQHIRILCYNINWDAIFENNDPANHPWRSYDMSNEFVRVVTAVDPDIVCLQEINSDRDPQDVADILDAALPLGGGETWRAHSGSDNVIAARFDLSMLATDTIPTTNRGQAMALVDLPDATHTSDLYLMNAHFKAGGNSSDISRRQQHADAIIHWIGDIKTSGGSIDLPADTPIIALGDFNVYDTDPAYHLTTLITGDIVDEGTYGSDVPPDWDNTDSGDALPLHNGVGPAFYTWRNDGSSFNPGALDRIIYTDSIFSIDNKFVLNTTAMSGADLAAAGLLANDVVLDPGSGYYDHLPLIVDLLVAGGPMQYTLTTNTTGQGNVAANPPGGVYDDGETVTLTATADPGWTFSNWTGDLLGGVNPDTITMDGDKAVTAVFTQDQYTLTINVSGSGSVGMIPNQATYTFGDIVTLTATADPGWTFSHWTGDLTGTANPDSVTMDGDKTVTAVFTQDQYTLTINVTGNGAVDSIPDQATYTYGEVVTLTASSDPGWTFSNWTGDMTGSANPDTITMDGHKTVLAVFTQDAYTLNVSITGSGSVGVVPDQTTYTFGDVVTLTANADPGWTFSNWTGDLTGNTNPDTITMDGDKSVTATLALDCPGDLDYDGDVDLSDLAQLLANYGAISGAAYADGDLDGDGDVDLTDLAELLAVYGAGC